MAVKKSSHILSTSSKLPDFCLAVLYFIKISKFSQGTVIDEITGLSAIYLMGVYPLISIYPVRKYNNGK